MCATARHDVRSPCPAAAPAPPRLAHPGAGPARLLPGLGSPANRLQACGLLGRARTRLGSGTARGHQPSHRDAGDYQSEHHRSHRPRHPPRALPHRLPASGNSDTREHSPESTQENHPRHPKQDELGTNRHIPPTAQVPGRGRRPLVTPAARVPRLFTPNVRTFQTNRPKKCAPEVKSGARTAASSGYRDRWGWCYWRDGVSHTLSGRPGPRGGGGQPGTRDGLEAALEDD